MVGLAQQTDAAAPWPVQVVFFVLVVGPVAYAFVHAVRHSEQQFAAVGSSKTLWIVLLVMTTLFAAVPYLFTVRRRLDRSVATAGRPAA